MARKVDAWKHWPSNSAERWSDPTAFYAGAVYEVRKYRPAHAADFDDLVQEGVIRAWQAVNENDVRDPKSYGGAAMRNQIARVMERGAQFGHTGKKVYEPLRHDTMRGPANAISVLGDRPAAPGTRLNEHIDIARQVSEALDSERERVIVYRKFWLDQDNTNIGHYLRLSSQTVDKIWKQNIAPKLRTALASYAEVC